MAILIVAKKPVGVLYRPPEHKLRNSKSRDYLGKVKLVVGSDLDELPGVTRFKRYSESGENSLLESASNAYPNTGPPSTLKRRFTVPILRTRRIASSPPPELSELTNGVSETQIRGPSKVLDGECGRESAFGDDSVTTLQIPKPPSTISHHRTRTPESDTQPRSPQDLAGRFTHLFSVVRCRWKRLCKLVMVCNSTHRFSE
ncbi:hypothetical protein EDC04DRAFT_2916666 [Pisolithus marmoratus]|nr:hypothetical protein EDC04DRAFT_2916666 [Pisolithus marmoratus]